MCRPRLVHTCVRIHSHVWHDAFICVTWLIHICDKTHSYIWHDSFIYVTWLMHICDMTHSSMWHDSVKYVTCLIHVRRDSFAYRQRLVCIRVHTFAYVSIRVHTCAYVCIRVVLLLWNDSFNWDVTHSYLRHDSLIYVTWLIYICDMMHSCKSRMRIRDSFFMGSENSFSMRIRNSFLMGIRDFKLLTHSWLIHTSMSHVCGFVTHLLWEFGTHFKWGFVTHSLDALMTHPYIYDAHMRIRDSFFIGTQDSL